MNEILFDLDCSLSLSVACLRASLPLISPCFVGFFADPTVLTLYIPDPSCKDDHWQNKPQVKEQSGDDKPFSGLPRATQVVSGWSRLEGFLYSRTLVDMHAVTGKEYGTDRPIVPANSNEKGDASTRTWLLAWLLHQS